MPEVATKPSRLTSRQARRVAIIAQRLLQIFSLYHFGHHAAGGNGGATAKRLEFYILNNPVLHFEKNLHDVAAFGIAYFADSISIFQFADIARVGKVVHNFFCIHSS